MFEIRVILHATDFSDSSEAALQIARSLASDHRARLLIVHVVHVAVVYGTIPERLDQAAERDSLEAIRARVDGPDLAHPVETRLREGDAAAEILRAAEEAGCDLIVMGTHGRSGLGRMVLGSVAEAVLRHAPCPVLTVKTPRPGAGSRG